MKHRATPAILSLILVVAACGGDDEDASPTTTTTVVEPLQGICAEEEVVDGVLVCTRPFDDGVAVRLPPERDGIAYGAVTRGGAAFVTVDGELPLDEAQRLELGRTTDYATTIYRATTQDGSLRVTPAARVDEDALLTAVFGGARFEGRISVLESPDTYGQPTAPVAITMEAEAADGRLRGRIDNATTAVAAADGSCLPSLSIGANAPLVDPYTADIAIERHPSMHVPFGDELVLLWSSDLSNMGSAWYPSVATLFGEDPLGDRWEAFLHGNPVYGPALDLRLVDGGGGSC